MKKNYLRIGLSFMNATMMVVFMMFTSSNATAQSNCLEAHGGIGCDDGMCKDVVCSIDPFCCDIAWDGLCAGEAEVSCPWLLDTGVDLGNCVEPHGGLGCENAECQATVCAVDPFCCDIAWDGICAGEAEALCDAGCDDAAEGPELSPCPGQIVLCGEQNVFWTPPTATDNCSTPTVSGSSNPGDFFNVGTTTVTYTATDDAGNTDNCSFDVVILPVPAVEIEQSDMPEWCQGVKVLYANVLNTGDLTPPVTIDWSDGLGSEPVVQVNANGTYFATVTDGNGCSTVASTFVDEDLSELLSAHTIVVDDEMDMAESTVLSGGVGVLDADEISITDNSNITTFLRSEAAVIDGSSNVALYINSESPIELPDFNSNPFGDLNDVNVMGAMTLNGSNYGNVVVATGSTLNIGNEEVYFKSLTVRKGGTVNFNQPTSLMVRKKINIASSCDINVEGPHVVVYSSDNVSIGQGSNVWVNIYAPEGLDVNESSAFLTTYMYGLFISDELNSGDNVVWGWNLNCADLGVDINQGYQGPPYCDDSQGGPGFPSYLPCETAICAADPFCCNTQWDGICAGAAESEPACADCLTPAGVAFCDEVQDGPGFPSDPMCEAVICGADPFCCNTQWDAICASAAASNFACSGCRTTGMLVQQETQPEAISDSSVDRVADLTVYPNPTAGEVNIAVEGYMGKTVDVKIFNALGKVVWTKHIDALETGIISLDMSNGQFPAGIYHLNLISEGQRITKQIVLTK